MSGLPPDPTDLLSRFGLTDFRPGQRDVIEAVRAGNDVLCVMPTGGGKSLCYQLPSLARDGITIVVSPLIALMKDQVDRLDQLGISARLINSSLSPTEQTEVMNEMAAGALDLVYVAPERLRNNRFLEAVSAANVTLLAVDEAHCVSEWGHDFRPDYARLGQFRRRYLHNVQTIALTATATPTVRQDVSELLGLDSPQIFVTGFARTNLRFGVTHCQSDRVKNDRLAAFLDQQQGAGIIYSATRKRCEELAEGLAEKTKRRVGVYHAGVDPVDRRAVQEAFMKGDLSAIVATNAFGMGIDKADIRYVVHYNMPGSLEAYYQEAGRAGRDGSASECLLMFSYQDRYIQEFFIENRYPAKQTVRKVHDYLLARPEDPIEMTLEQVRDAIGVKDGSESIGTAETLLARAGVLKRLDSNANHALVRIDSDAPTMLDFLPKEAKLRRKVMQAVEKVIGNRRGEDVFVRPSRLAEMADVQRDQLSRTLRELQRLKAFDYVPPFRGRALHVIERDVPFDQLEIDFDELQRRKAAEYEKLEAVFEFAHTAGCRQRVILDYFGDPKSENCGRCDRCQPHTDSHHGNDRSVAVADTGNEALVQGIRIVLSGIARMHGRFGKNLVAQMLCGSKNKKLQQWKLDRLSTYAMLSPLKQTDVVGVIDSLIQAGLVEQREVDQRRPTIQLSDAGKRVMKGVEAVPAAVQIARTLANRLAAAARSIESDSAPRAGSESAPAEQSPETPPSNQPSSIDATAPADEELLGRLKRFRRKRSAVLGIPAYRVLTNATIDRLAQQKPQSIAELEAVAGIGPSTIEQFGQELIDLIGQSGRWEAASPTELEEPPSRPGDGQPQPASPESFARAPRAGETRAGETRAGETRAGETRAGETRAGETRAGKSAVGDDREAADETSAIDATAASGAALAQVPSLAQTPTDATSDAYWTWRLLQDGYSAEELMQIRRCDLEALVDDLEVAASAGHPIDPAWIASPEAETRLRLASQISARD